MSTALTQGLQRISGQALAFRRPVTRTRLPFNPSSGFACSGFGRGIRTQPSLHILRAARPTDQSALDLAPSSDQSAQPAPDQQQSIRREQLHESSELPASAINSSGPPEGDQDTEMLNMAAASQSEAQLVSEATQLPAGVEVEAVPQTAAVPEPALPESSVTASNSAPGQRVIPEWEPILQQFLDMLLSKGHYNSPVKANSYSIAVLKKGILDFARSRQDILFVLPEPKILAVLTAGVPFEERKLTIAIKRLSTTFQGVVGPLGAEGSFQDLMRFVIAGAYSHSMYKGHVQNVKPTDKVDWSSHSYNSALVAALADILPDIIAAAEVEPTPEAQAKAEASTLVREQKAVTALQPAIPAKKLRPSNARGDPTPDTRRQDRSRFFMEKGWEGFEDSQAKDNMRPGDWICAECNQHNFARNRECYKCGAPNMEAAGQAMTSGRGGRSFDRQPSSFGNDAEGQAGDWNCDECGTSNFARRNRCFKCGIPRSKSELGVGQKPGDWACPSCSANNFSRRTECFRCSTPKPGNEGYRSQGRDDTFSASPRAFGGFSSRPDRSPRGTDGTPFQYEAKPGDWSCDSCGANNFARRGVCFKCGAAKSGGSSSTMSTSGRATGRVFDNRQQESSWFDGSDTPSPSSSSSSSRSSSSAWDPRSSLGAAQPQDQSYSPRSSSPRGGFDRAQGNFGRGSGPDSSPRGSYSSSRRGSMKDRAEFGGDSDLDWSRGQAIPSRGRGGAVRGKAGSLPARGRGSPRGGQSFSSGRAGADKAGADKPWEGRPDRERSSDELDGF